MFRCQADEHFIDDGRVYCPLRECDVELDLCAGCRWAKRIELNARPPLVRCRPEGAPIWLLRPWF